MEEDAVPERATAGLLPVYTTSVPDEAVNLCQGRFGVRQDGYYGEGEGTLDVAWTSGPHLRFDVPSLTPFGAVSAADRCPLRTLIECRSDRDHIERSSHWWRTGTVCWRAWGSEAKRCDRQKCDRKPCHLSRCEFLALLGSATSDRHAARSGHENP